MLSEDVLNEEMAEAVFMCNMLYSRASGRVSGTAPHPCACCPPWAGLGSTMYQYPHHGWHLWSRSQCSLSLFTDFRALWPEGYIFLVHVLILSLLCLKTSCDLLSAPRIKSKRPGLAFTALANGLSSTVGLLTSAHVAVALRLASFPSWSAWYVPALLQHASGVTLFKK